MIVLDLMFGFIAGPHDCVGLDVWFHCRAAARMIVLDLMFGFIAGPHDCVGLDVWFHCRAT